MGKKKAFIGRREGESFRLVPSSSNGQSESNSFKPSKEHLEEQHKYGIFYDDDYDYMKHLRDVNEKGKLEPMFADRNGSGEGEEAERSVIRVPADFPLHSASSGKRVEFFDPEVSTALQALEGREGGVEVEDGGLEDNFVELAGGIIDEGMMMFRRPRQTDAGVFDDEDLEDEEEMDSGEEYFSNEEGELQKVHREGGRRDIDEAFDRLLEQDYHNEQVGELDGDDDRITGLIEPEVGQLRQIIDCKLARAKEDDQTAKQYVRERMKLLEEGVIKEVERTQLIEVDESSRKRMKWDCESFATLNSTAYNQPSLIKDRTTRLSRKALKKLDADSKRLDEDMEAEEREEGDGSSDVDMEEDNESQCTTVSTVRIKGETPEQRRLRKQAVKEAKRFRRQEKKANKTAFAEEHRKMAKARVGQIKTVSIN